MAAIREGMRIAQEWKQAFLWLTCTNAGAEAVCLAVLWVLGITEEDLEKGYLLRSHEQVHAADRGPAWGIGEAHA